jgi:predicted NBD/HSP70 family sugar kinase
MHRHSGYGPKVVRQYNELNILRFIKNENPISRADIAKRYKISKAAVSEIIAHLLQQGYVSEIGVGNSTRIGGRKPILLAFNPKAGFAIGVEIKRDHARVALGDLDAGIHENQMFQFQNGAPLKDVLDEVFKIIDSFRNIDWVKKAKPIGIGVAIPGLIDYESGRIRESDTLKNWQDYPIRDAFVQRYGIETRIENDVKTISIGECRFGNGKDTSNIVYLWLGDGIGAGIVINGELYRGVSASAGEVGFFELGCCIREFDEFKLLYNGQKYFGDILSGKELQRGAAKGLRNGYEGMMDPEKLDVDSILAEADKNNPLAIELLREYGFLVGVVCIHLINTLNPELILIGGPAFTQNERLLKFIREKIQNDVLRTPSSAVRVRGARLHDDAGIVGAIGLILEDLFYMEKLNIKKYRDVFGRRS